MWTEFTGVNDDNVEDDTAVYGECIIAPEAWDYSSQWVRH